MDSTSNHNVESSRSDVVGEGVAAPSCTIVTTMSQTLTDEELKFAANRIVLALVEDPEEASTTSREEEDEEVVVSATTNNESIVIDASSSCSPTTLSSSPSSRIFQRNQDPANPADDPVVGEVNSSLALLSEEDAQAKREQELLNVVLVRAAAASAAVRASRIQQVSNYCFPSKPEEGQQEDHPRQGDDDPESQRTMTVSSSSEEDNSRMSLQNLVVYDNRGRPITKNLQVPPGGQLEPHDVGAFRVQGPGFGDTDNNPSAASADCVLVENNGQQQQDNSAAGESGAGDDSSCYGQKLTNTTKFLLGGCLLLVLLAVAIIVISVVLDASSNNGLELPPWSEIPTTTDDQLLPLVDKEEEQEELVDEKEDLIMTNLPASTLQALDDYYAPQSVAYDWLAKDPNLDNYTDWRRKQRFALATWKFTQLGSEHQGEGHLWYPLHECQWYSSSKQQKVCNPEGRILKLKLPPSSTSVWGSSTGSFALNILPPEIVHFLGDHLEAVEVSGRTFANKGMVVGGTGFPTGSAGDTSNVAATASVLQLTNLRYLRINNPNNIKITGTIPTAIGTQLTKLEHLDLSYNEFTGPIPTEFGLLSNLRFLRLFQNDLSGTIPMDWGQPQQLQDLQQDLLLQASNSSNNTNSNSSSLLPQPPLQSVLGNLTTLDVRSNPKVVPEIPNGFCLQQEPSMMGGDEDDDDDASSMFLDILKTDWCNGKLDCCNNKN